MAQDTPQGDGEPGRSVDPSDGPVDARTGAPDSPAEQPGGGTPDPAAAAGSSSPWARPDTVGAGSASPASADAERATGDSDAGTADQGEHPETEGVRSPSGQDANSTEPVPQSPYTQNPYAQNPYDQNPYDQNPYAQDLHARNPHAAGAYAQAPYPQGAPAEGQFPQGAYPQGQYAQGQYPQVGYAQGQFPQGPYGAGQQGPGTAPYPAGAPPYGGFPPGGPGGYPQGPPPPSARGRTGRLVAAAIALALVAGGVGGAIGADIAGSSGSTDGGSLSSPVSGDGSDAPPTQIEQVSQKVLPSLVQLRAEGGSALARGEQTGGSGMVVSADGLVLTNNHVVEPAASGGALRAVFQDGRTAPMRIIGRDPESDVAVIKADNVGGLTPVELGNSDGVRIGQQVVALGSPFGIGASVTTGIVSALNRAVSIGGENGGPSTVLSALQTDAAINPGNSGGPLVDMAGRVVGINSAIATAGPGGGSIGVGFSIPINQAKRIADQLRTTGKATHPVLGVEVTDDPQETGARVRTVAPDGPAARAGLKPNDLVVRLGNQRVTTGTELQAAVRSQTPRATVDLQLSNKTVRVTLGEM